MKGLGLGAAAVAVIGRLSAGDVERGEVSVMICGELLPLSAWLTWFRACTSSSVPAVDVEGWSRWRSLSASVLRLMATPLTRLGRRDL